MVTTVRVSDATADAIIAHYGSLGKALKHVAVTGADWFGRYPKPDGAKPMSVRIDEWSKEECLNKFGTLNRALYYAESQIPVGSGIAEQVLPGVHS